VQIDDKTSIQDVKERLGVGQDEELRESEKRRRYLEKYSRIITPKRPTLRMKANHPTASVNQEDDEPVIHMTTRAFDQPITEFPRKIYDLIMQEALTVHEVGHILYTDHDSFVSQLGKVDVGRKKMFKKLWNILEDGAIERQLRHRFRVEDELEVLNRNLMENDSPGHAVDEDTERYSLYQAVTLGLCDMALWQTGQFQRLLNPDDDSLTMASEKDAELLDEAVPLMKSVSSDVLSQPVSEKRNERIYEFWTEFSDLLDDADVSGENESNLEDLIGDDGSVGGGPGGDEEEGDDGGDASPIDGKPDDTENDLTGEAATADELGRGDVQAEIEVQIVVASGGDPEDADIDPDELGTVVSASAQSGEEDGEDGDDTTPGLDADVSHLDDMEEDFRDELAQEASELDGGESTIEEVEQYMDIIGGQQGGDTWRGLTLEIPEEPDKEFARSRYNESQQVSKRLASDFRNRLLREQRDKVKRGKRRGRFDRSRMVHAARGSTRVFKKEEKGEDKDYSCMVVVDRSGSMGGYEIENAEMAVGALTAALDEVGVRTSLLDLYQSEARLVKPFGQDLTDVKEHVFNGQAGGGTPLTQVLKLARERLSDHDNPFMIVVTDGRPANQSEYRDVLDKCSFPVLGVYTAGSRAGDGDYFHRQVQVGNGDDLQSKLHNLANEVMF